MNLKVSRIFGILSAALHGVALVVSLFSFLLRPLIFRLMHAPEDMFDASQFYLPVNTILGCSVSLLIAVLYLVLILALKPSKGGSIAVVIVFAVVLFLTSALISPLLSTAATAITGRYYGSRTLAAVSMLETGAGFLTRFFTVPASLLMLLSMGGYWGKCVPKNRV